MDAQPGPEFRTVNISAPLLTTGAATLLLTLALAELHLLGWLSIGTAALCFVALAAIVARTLPVHRLRFFGLANGVTLVRGGIASILAGMTTEIMLGWPFSAHAAWLFAGLALTGLILDGVDGPIARRTGTATAFGARFDMEVDAFLLMVLSTAAWSVGAAGVWILLTGLMRYLFVIAAKIWPVLAAPLPEHFRRKLICVVDILALIVMMMPIVHPPTSTIIGFGAVAVLVYSFAVDILWLLRNARRYA